MDFAHFNNSEASNEGYKCNNVERHVDVLTLALPVQVFRCNGLLEEDRLGESEDGYRHGDWVAGEEANGARGDVCPDVAAEYEDAYFGDDAGSNKGPSHDARSLR